MIWANIFQFRFIDVGIITGLSDFLFDFLDNFILPMICKELEHYYCKNRTRNFLFELMSNSTAIVHLLINRIEADIESKIIAWWTKRSIWVSIFFCKNHWLSKVMLPA